MNPKIKIAVAQLNLSIHDVAGNFESSIKAIKEAAQAGAQLIVLPELTNSGYAFENLSQAHQNAWEQNGKEIGEWCDLSRDLQIVLVAGVNLKRADKLFNCVIIIDQGKILGVYEKAHLWGNEPDFFERGKTLPLVVDTSIGRVATMVCYDVEFTEWVRYALLNGAQILALPTNWPETGLPRNPTAMEVVRVQAAASQNKLVIAACDRTGSENGVDWVSQSVIVNSDGIIQSKAQSNASQILYAQVELPINDEIGPRNAIKADRREDLYHLKFTPANN